MPRYQYVAIDVDGRRRNGGLDAGDEAAARAELQRRKLLPIEVAASSSRAAARAETAQPKTAGRREALSHKARLIVTRQLATLIDAAVPVDEALGMIAAQQDSPAAGRIMSEVQAGVLEGQRLADALGRRPESFSGLYRSAVAGGERAGSLGPVLNRLADYLASAYALRSKISTAMIYPAALSAVAIVVVTCLMIFVVPSLTEQFRNFDARLPLLTMMLIGVSEFLTQFWALLLIALGGLAYFGSVLWRREGVRRAIDRASLNMPLLGRWAVNVNASRFVRAVSTLVSAGLPVLDSVRAARESVGNRIMADAIWLMAARIEEGEPLSHAMRRSELIPAMVVYMAASGENAGDLPRMLDKAADHLDQEFEAFVTSALSLLEPAIIVFMGVVVASIVLAIMLPVLQLNRLAIG